MAFYLQPDEDDMMRKAAKERLKAQQEAQEMSEKKSTLGTIGGIAGAIIAAATAAPPQVGYQLGSGVGRIAADPSAKGVEEELNIVGNRKDGLDMSKLMSLISAGSGAAGTTGGAA